MFLLIKFSVLNEVLDIEEEDTEHEEGYSTSVENGVETHSYLVSTSYFLHPETWKK